MQTIYSMCQYRHPVWAVSHAGHCAPPDSMDMLQGKTLFDPFIWNSDNEASSEPEHENTPFNFPCPGAAEDGDVFGLSGQVEHKLAFIRTHVPRGTTLVLVGHSIGCYIILEMMKRSPDLKVWEYGGQYLPASLWFSISIFLRFPHLKAVCPLLQVMKSIMLFPTIERMAQTPQGRLLTPVLCYFRYLAYLPVFLLSILPEGLKACLIRLLFGGIPFLDHTVIQPTVELLSGDCAGSLQLFLF